MGARMFNLQVIDPAVYRVKTRQATWIIMGGFMVLGFGLSMGFVEWFWPGEGGKFWYQMGGALTGLFITAGVVSLFKEADWMKEAMYGFLLKRNLMRITNRLRPLNEAVERGDVQAMRIVRFYHLGLEQMHRFEQNSHAQVELSQELASHLVHMQSKGLETAQTAFDPDWLESYPLTAQTED